MGMLICLWFIVQKFLSPVSSCLLLMESTPSGPEKTTKEAKKRSCLPLIPLPTHFYDTQFPNAALDPTDKPSRKRHWFIAFALDWVLIALLLGLGQYFFSGPQPPKAYFALNDVSLQHPEVPEIISATNATIINAVGPLIILAVIELLFFFNKWDAYHMVKGHGESIAISLFFTSLLWIIVGGSLGLRPTFLTKCQPDPTKIVAGQIYYSNEVCKQELGKFEYQGFPSGHSSTAFAGWTFFTLYINAKIKPWGGSAQLWKVLILILPTIFASWISLTRVIDYHHFPYQIITGGLIGIASALIAYRINYGSDGNWLWGTGSSNDNHIPAHYIRLATEPEITADDVMLTQIVTTPMRYGSTPALIERTEENVQAV
ncbi:PAP2 superfamily-domain-containing protein [Jimgerdemannia flammicorona]|uniref:PAP2 superfamily-domain-containing protein n=1 Tax=Jimgerdemannia flammicorona TaxID=994334 RepID=A0A433Q4G1_9FUNG|nr:PAP2 superfamily-domain-containing protein [Jimgerdemannia flammicorona]